MGRKVGVALSYVLMLFEVLSTLLLTPYIISSLGQAEYGVFNLIIALNAYLLLLDLGVGNATIRFVSKYRVNKERLKEQHFFAIIIVYYVIIAIIATIIGLFILLVFPNIFAKGLSQNELQLGQILLGIAICNAAVTLATSPYNNILIAYELFFVSRVASIVQIVLRMLATFIVLYFGWGSIGVASVNLFMTVLLRGFFMLYVLFYIKLRPMFKGLKVSFFKEVATYSSFILIQMVATQVNSSLGQILIGSLVVSSAQILAVYGVGTQIVQYFMSLGSAFTSVLMPGVVKLVENNSSREEITKEMVKIGRIIFIFLSIIFCGFIVCGKEFVCLWAGTKNEQAYIVALVLMSAQLLIHVESIGTQILWAKNEHKEQSLLKIVIVLVNIITTIILIKWNPLIGATLGTYISLFMGDILVMNLLFVKKLNIDIAHYYKKLLENLIPCLVLTLLFGFFIDSILPIGWIWLFAKILLMVIVYILSLYYYGMSRYEKNIFDSLLVKALKLGGIKR